MVGIFLLFGNKTTRLLRTRTVDCWEAWYLFSSIHYVQSRSIFFQKSGVDFTDFARLNVRFVRTKSFSLVSAFAIACMFSINRFSADVAGELLASSMIR